MVIAIDGPAGAGKSSVARAAAERLGFTYLDTGAMYRAVACRARRTAPTRPRSPRSVRIELGERVRARRRGRRPSASASRGCPRPRRACRPTPACARRSSPSSGASSGEGDWVAEGRDIGTVVAPDAEVKVFLTAAPEERARRRAAELGTDAGVVLQRADDARRARPQPRALAARAGRRRGPGRHDRAVARGGRRPDRHAGGRGQGARRHEEDRRRRLPERRQVLARQPAHAVPRGRRARDVGDHARPQGARHRLERPQLRADRHRRRRPRGHRAARRLDPRPGARGAVGRRRRAVRGRRARRDARRRHRGGGDAAPRRPAGRAGRQQDRLAARRRARPRLLQPRARRAAGRLGGAGARHRRPARPPRRAAARRRRARSSRRSSSAWR